MTEYHMMLSKRGPIIWI